MDKKVSVIIPTYKRCDFLQRAIDSVLNQTYKNVEVVVVDDNIPQSEYRLKTEKIMEKYKDNINVIYIKNTKNIGGALSRNKGIKFSSGDYITFLDDDDIYLPYKIEKQLTFMIEHDLEMSFTNVRVHNSKDKLIDFREHSYIKNWSNEDLLKQHLMHHLTPTTTYMYKKDSLKRIGGFEKSKVGQEFILMLKSIERGLKIGYLPRADVIQYVHENERISVGPNKMNNERQIYNLKKKYFNRLKFREKQYIKFRYHAVMTVVGKRSKAYVFALKHLFLVFLISPLDCVYELIKQYKKIKKYSKQ
ncbi:Glycosyl transferase family 2 [Alkalithermobacter thermoalcaliphilus JW-YL-7 = DSM 7308]|uniref:Glycosyl transferase family 2 n=1 Tax=Alkalithermobacter thermoalcaliphilus JW-YL-7 = DSM 7308 TaxID=1121328 RepID=A0A150FSH8_CLOPD|nr:glycosyl transferase family 2 [[Clostridium] paradoxum JW-YL-7 = DSM 7308]SHK70066.1 Glycosyl transferase family 2 [[Clostridium] paradoxum JW-YL-7 = DSM 7308]